MGHYPEGSRVDVYYDPQKPSESVLDPGTGTKSGTYMFLAALNHVEFIDKKAFARLLNGTPRFTKKLRT